MTAAAGWPAGWAADDHAAALAAFARSAAAGGRWGALAAEAARVRPAAARAFLEARLAPGPPLPGGPGLLTGYCEPTAPAARTRSARFAAPLHAPPPPPLRGLSRAEIMAGGLDGLGLELFWVEDAIEAFFLETQGSARLVLEDGSVARIGFAARNGRPWRSPGRMLVEAGELAADAVTAEAVKAWLRADPARGRALLARCEAVAFFETRDLPADEGPLGALGAPVTPDRSVAVDPAFHALGGLVWIEAETRGGPLRRLVAAQDVGGAIRGPHRADLFFGWDAAAAARAGALAAPLRITPLLPREGGP